MHRWMKASSVTVSSSLACLQILCLFQNAIPVKAGSKMGDKLNSVISPLSILYCSVGTNKHKENTACAESNNQSNTLQTFPCHLGILFLKKLVKIRNIASNFLYVCYISFLCCLHSELTYASAWHEGLERNPGFPHGQTSSMSLAQPLTDHEQLDTTLRRLMKMGSTYVVARRCMRCGLTDVKPQSEVKPHPPKYGDICL